MYESFRSRHILTTSTSGLPATRAVPNVNVFSKLTFKRFPVQQLEVQISKKVVLDLTGKRMCVCVTGHLLLPV